jgi:hypothetical protein
LVGLGGRRHLLGFETPRNKSKTNHDGNLSSKFGNLRTSTIQKREKILEFSQHLHAQTLVMVDITEWLNRNRGLRSIFYIIVLLETLLLPGIAGLFVLVLWLRFQTRYNATMERRGNRRLLNWTAGHTSLFAAVAVFLGAIPPPPPLLR